MDPLGYLRTANVALGALAAAALVIATYRHRADGVAAQGFAVGAFSAAGLMFASVLAGINEVPTGPRIGVLTAVLGVLLIYGVAGATRHPHA